MSAITKPVYLDYAATTPVDPRVAERMMECLTIEGVYANPTSTGHALGRTARQRVEAARIEVAALINAAPDEIIWTSGATESDNLAILGAARFYADRGKHIVTSRTEHKAVLEACKVLDAEGFEISYLRPQSNGLIRPGDVEAATRADTILVSVMHVNNEIGVVQDIASIGRRCRERGIKFHVDAAQSAGKVVVDVEDACVDLLAITAHKVYGPKGVGALYVRREPHCGLVPMSFGGGQERGLRAGTLATHQIAGMGHAFAIAAAELSTESQRLEALRQRLWDGICVVGGIHLNGDPVNRTPGILNVSFEGLEGESLVLALRDLAVSTGAACTTASAEPSYVLRALGRSDQLAQSSIRFCLGRFTTEQEVEFAIGLIQEQVLRLRRVAGSAVATVES